MNANFLKDYGKIIIKKNMEDKGVLFNPLDDNSKELELLMGENRIPLVGQVAPIITAHKVMERYDFCNLIAEQGTGKTQMSYSTATLMQAAMNNKGLKIAFLTSGSKHLKKMGDEAKAIFGDENVTIKFIRNFKDVPGVIEDSVDEGKFIVYLISKDSAKLSYPKMKLKVKKCPNCKGKISPKDNICPNVQVNGGIGKNPKKDKNIPLKDAIPCGFSLIVPKPMKNNKISIAEAFNRVYSKTKKKIFDLLIVDEVHEMASGVSQQGKAYRALAYISKKVLIMTGTLSNGYSSSLFYILFGLMPKQMVKWGYSFDDIEKWVDHFGAKRTTRRVDDSGRGSRFNKIQELPVISGRIISKLAPYTIWLKMEDLNIKMPPISEIPVQVSMEDELSEHITAYKKELESTLEYMEDKDAKRKKRGMLSSLMFLQDNPYLDNYNIDFDVYKLLYNGELNKLPTKEEMNEVGYESTNFFSDVSENSVTDIFEKINIQKTFQPFNLKDYTNKEKKLVEILTSEFTENRNSLVYSIYNGKGGVNKRLLKVLEEHFPEKTIEMLPDSIKSENIQLWIEEHPSDILIASPLKLATGFDLVQFPNIMFYEYGYDIKMISQAARRSWRAVGQDKPVKVYYIAYSGIQSKALELVGQKMRAAAVVQGQEVTEDALSSIYDTNSIETELINSLAKDIKDEKLNFESSIVSLDKVRPWSDFEKEYLLLKAQKDEEITLHSAVNNEPLYDKDVLSIFEEGRLF